MCTMFRMYCKGPQRIVILGILLMQLCQCPILHPSTSSAFVRGKVVWPPLSYVPCHIHGRLGRRSLHLLKPSRIHEESDWLTLHLRIMVLVFEKKKNLGHFLLSKAGISHIIHHFWTLELGIGNFEVFKFCQVG